MAKKKRVAKLKPAKPCVDCEGLGVVFDRYVDPKWGVAVATILRCDTCRKYADNHEASQAIEGKARLYDEIMAVRPEHLLKRGAA
jgi:hypothetical protein